MWQHVFCPEGVEPNTLMTGTLLVGAPSNSDQHVSRLERGGERYQSMEVMREKRVVGDADW
jgi:hypothetical protein